MGPRLSPLLGPAGSAPPNNGGPRAPPPPGGAVPLEHLDQHDRPGRALAIRTRLAELLRDEAPLLTPARFEYLLRDLTDEVSGLGPLEPLLADPEVSEV